MILLICDLNFDVKIEYLKRMKEQKKMLMVELKYGKNEEVNQSVVILKDGY